MSSRPRRHLLSLVCSCSLMAMATLPALADSGNDSSSSSDQISALKAQADAEKVALSQLNQEQQSIRRGVDALAGELSSSQADLDHLTAEAEDLAQQVTALDTLRRQVQHEHDQRVRLLAAQIKHLYELDSLGVFAYLVQAHDFNDFLNRAVYLVRMARSSSDEARQLGRQQAQIDADRRHATQLRARLEPLLAELRARTADLNSRYQSQAAVESQLEASQRAQLAQLTGTERRLQQLEAALAAQEAAARAAQQKASAGGSRAYGAVCPAASPGTVSFCGHGFGHGVGLGQYGAYGMAQAGASWPSILLHFYSGTTITSLPAGGHDPIIRVLLPAAGPAVIPRAAPATLQGSTDASPQSVPADTTVNFSLSGGQVQASWGSGAHASSSNGVLQLVAGPGGYFQTSGYDGACQASSVPFRGDAWVVADGGLRVVDHVPVEAYLRGLGEVPSSWPQNALRAQIGAARSYAVYHLSGSGIDDLDNTTSSQVYCGMNRETPAQDAAVASTASQVVTYRGSVIDAVFSSSDGGHTECASATWGSGADGSACSPPYLQGVIDNYDVSPLHTWYTPGYSLSQIQQFLGASYAAHSCQGNLDGFDLSKRDASDRLRTVRLLTSAGSCSLSSSDFISAFNAGSPANAVIYGNMFGVTPGNQAWPYW